MSDANEIIYFQNPNSLVFFVCTIKSTSNYLMVSGRAIKWRRKSRLAVGKKSFGLIIGLICLNLEWFAEFLRFINKNKNDIFQSFIVKRNQIIGQYNQECCQHWLCRLYNTHCIYQALTCSILCPKTLFSHNLNLHTTRFYFCCHHGVSKTSNVNWRKQTTLRCSV